MKAWICCEGQTDTSAVGIYSPSWSWNLELTNLFMKVPPSFQLHPTATITSWGGGAGWFLLGWYSENNLIPQMQKPFAMNFVSKVCPESLYLGSSTGIFCMPSSQVLLFTLLPSTTMLFTDCISNINHWNVTAIGWYILRPMQQVKWWMKKGQSCMWA